MSVTTPGRAGAACQPRPQGEGGTEGESNPTLPPARQLMGSEAGSASTAAARARRGSASGAQRSAAAVDGSGQPQRSLAGVDGKARRRGRSKQFSGKDHKSCNCESRKC